MSKSSRGLTTEVVTATCAIDAATRPGRTAATMRSMAAACLDVRRARSERDGGLVLQPVQVVLGAAARGLSTTVTRQPWDKVHRHC